jgi:hypothetical protein
MAGGARHVRCAAVREVHVGHAAATALSGRFSVLHCLTERGRQEGIRDVFRTAFTSGSPAFSHPHQLRGGAECVQVTRSKVRQGRHMRYEARVCVV